ncbi:DUF4156 domain-containing protein [Echinimonas agarilytica]|uniref:DUF4156 domain-containing protein n=1 Tax=Echinimonas agarilytica TaxID=1215918 RepID=A0AA42B800_9GAMM|nr:DUF4156 domain-containing protein [Echinimonas agarilytica]MCM2679913.1 DUF4156 domain-containing protein [Echinimonas agarilytica]
MMQRSTPYFKKMLFWVALILAGCTHTDLYQGSEGTRISFLEDDVAECKSLGEVIGTEGHWYNYWFISNRELLQSSLNDIRNQAAQRGADVVYLPRDISFETSVTFVGTAYDCRP